jgi:hypothetical protein
MEDVLIKKKFQEIGSDVIFSEPSAFMASRMATPITIDVVNRKGKEIYNITKNPNEHFDVKILDVQKKDRHLLLMTSQPVLNSKGTLQFLQKNRVLCGHDERHFFSAGVRDAVSTVQQAKESLLPPEFKEAHRKKGKKKNLTKRSNETGKRQGEWLFIKSEWEPSEKEHIHMNEPISRGGRSKPHICQELVNRGGETVYVDNHVAPNGVSYNEMLKLQKKHPRANFQQRTANATVYVQGTVRHPDHSTIKLIGWHKVIMNREEVSGPSVFLD